QELWIDQEPRVRFESVGDGRGTVVAKLLLIARIDAEQNRLGRYSLAPLGRGAGGEGHIDASYQEWYGGPHSGSATHLGQQFERHSQGAVGHLQIRLTRQLRLRAFDRRPRAAVEKLCGHQRGHAEGDTKRRQEQAHHVAPQVTPTEK